MAILYPAGYEKTKPIKANLETNLFENRLADIDLFLYSKSLNSLRRTGLPVSAERSAAKHTA